MGKTIAVLTGSPRANGNSFALTNAFIKAAEAKGHTVTRFDTAKMKIDGCRACDKCYSKGQPCVFNDDFNPMAEMIEKADAVVFTAPLYWYTFPAQIKAALDRMYSFMVGKRDIAGKQCAIITCCEEADPAVLEGILYPYRQSTGLMGWTSVGEVLVPGVYEAGAVNSTDGLATATALADAF